MYTSDENLSTQFSGLWFYLNKKRVGLIDTGGNPGVVNDTLFTTGQS